MRVIDGKIYLEVHEMSDFYKEVKDQVGSGQFGLRLLIFKLKCTFTFPRKLLLFPNLSSSSLYFNTPKITPKSEIFMALYAENI